MTTDNTNTTRNDSLAARTDTWLQSFLVWSPGQRDIIKTVALVLMVLDHINRKRLVRTVLIFTESSDQLSRATDRVPGLPASPGYVQ
ncbi:hypothetical protein QS254_25220, partial [Escherichia coli]|nr:hypothetical protein [Escherichia coli]